jgi:hypothetical protein
MREVRLARPAEASGPSGRVHVMVTGMPPGNLLSFGGVCTAREVWCSASEPGSGTVVEYDAKDDKGEGSRAGGGGETRGAG